MTHVLEYGIGMAAKDTFVFRVQRVQQGTESNKMKTTEESVLLHPNITVTGGHQQYHFE